MLQQDAPGCGYWQLCRRGFTAVAVHATQATLQPGVLPVDGQVMLPAVQSLAMLWLAAPGNRQRKCGYRRCRRGFTAATAHATQATLKPGALPGQGCTALPTILFWHSFGLWKMRHGLTWQQAKEGQAQALQARLHGCGCACHSDDPRAWSAAWVVLHSLA